MKYLRKRGDQLYLAPANKKYWLQLSAVLNYLQRDPESLATLRLADVADLLSDDPDVARRLLELVGSLPRPVWGRDELRTGEMWNSNSVIAWLLARSGLPMEAIRPPAGGRAPGWEAGLVMARRHQASDDRGRAHIAQYPGSAVTVG